MYLGHFSHDFHAQGVTLKDKSLATKSIFQSYSQLLKKITRLVLKPPRCLLCQVYIHTLIADKSKSKDFTGGSGVATGWHGWTMSRGPGAKGAPERERQKIKKMKKRKEWKEKREQTRYIPMSLSIPKLPKSNIAVIITQSLKYETNNGELGPHMYSFSACMSSKISQLKFGAHKWKSAMEPY